MTRGNHNHPPLSRRLSIRPPTTTPNHQRRMEDSHRRPVPRPHLHPPQRPPPPTSTTIDDNPRTGPSRTLIRSRTMATPRHPILRRRPGRPRVMCHGTRIRRRPRSEQPDLDRRRTVSIPPIHLGQDGSSRSHRRVIRLRTGLRPDLQHRRRRLVVDERRVVTVESLPTRRMSLKRLVAILLVFTSCVVQPVKGDVTPDPGLTPQTCRDGGLFVIFDDDFPKRPGQPWTQNGFICVEHVNP